MRPLRPANMTGWMNYRIPALLAAALASCVRAPDSYPLPAQYVMPSGPESAAAKLDGPRPLLGMSDPDLESRIVQDVRPAPDGDDWRWTGEHPKFRLTLDDVTNLQFCLDLSMRPETLRDTGPVTLTIRINDALLDRPTFAWPGDQEYARAVPAGVLKGPGDVVVSLDVDRPWMAPDQVKLGIYLRSIGFRKRAR
ncbi:MAG: hypothetical protein HY238_01665 [Acidobacteria bacterium]|nr:hypothetical protein [Acidobacteriota bacterium]